MKLPPLLLFGAGGHAKVVLDALGRLNALPMLVLDDVPRVPTLQGSQVEKNTPAMWKEYPSFRFRIALGQSQNMTRARLFGEFLERGGIPNTVIHPSKQTVSVGERRMIGTRTSVIPGITIGTGVTIGAGSSEASVEMLKSPRGSSAEFYGTGNTRWLDLRGVI